MSFITSETTFLIPFGAPSWDFLATISQVIPTTFMTETHISPRPSALPLHQKEGPSEIQLLHARQSLPASHGNPNLFPELSIPRTTALGWINRPKEYPPMEVDSIFKQRIKELEKKLKKEEALVFLLWKIRRIHPFDFKKKWVRKKKTKEEIIPAITDAMKFHKLSTRLEAIALSRTTYSRWHSEVKR